MVAITAAIGAASSPDASADFSDPPGPVPTGRVIIFKRIEYSPPLLRSSAIARFVLFTPAPNMRTMAAVGGKLCVVIPFSKRKT